METLISFESGAALEDSDDDWGAMTWVLLIQSSAAS
jgi:hypothetical protein